MAGPSSGFLEQVFGAAYRLPPTGSTTATLRSVSLSSRRVGRRPTQKGGEMRLGTLLLIIIIVLLVLFLFSRRRGRL
jgi:hypothetical protein